MAIRVETFLLVLVLVQTIKMEPPEAYSPFVISTTPKPSQEKYNKLLLEQLQEMHTMIKVNKYRLEILEMQNVQMKDSLQKFLQLHEFNNTLLGQQQILSKIENIFEDKLKVMNTCGNQNESQNQMFKELEKIKSKISQMEGLIHRCDSKNQWAEFQDKIYDKLDKIYNELLNSYDRINVQSTEKPDIESNDELTTLPKTCKEVQQRGNNITGTYTIKPEASPAPLEVRCNMQTHGGGWTYVLSRFDGSQDFYLNWTDYKNGFGNLSGEFWMGLEHLYEMTGSFSNQLLVELRDWEDKIVYAHFKNFQIDSEPQNYKLKVLSHYSGDAGDSLAKHVGAEFSTLDHQGVLGHCVKNHKAAWWFTNGCFYAQLTGIYQKHNLSKYATGIHWGNFHGYSYSLKQAAMMIKPSE